MKTLSASHVGGVCLFRRIVGAEVVPFAVSADRGHEALAALGNALERNQRVPMAASVECALGSGRLTQIVPAIVEGIAVAMVRKPPLRGTEDFAPEDNPATCPGARNGDIATTADKRLPRELKLIGISRRDEDYEMPIDRTEMMVPAGARLPRSAVVISLNMYRVRMAHADTLRGAL